VIGDKRAEVLSRMIRAAVAGLLVGSVLGFAASFTAPVRYEAHTDVFVAAAPGAQISEAIDDRVLRSYVTLLNSRPTAEAVHDELESGLSVRQVEEALSAKIVDRSTVIRVTARQARPDVARQMSTTAATSFVDRLVKSGAAIRSGQDTTSKKSKDDADTGADDEASGDDTSAAPTPTVLLSVADDAGGSTAAGSPSRPTWALWGGLIGLVLFVAVSIVRRATDRAVRSADDLEELTGLPLIGAFGFDRTAARQSSAADQDPHGPRSEAARIMRSNLQFIGIDQPSSVITITSAVPGEGKTTVAADLAISLARGGQSVVLVEGDLRRPKLARRFDVSSSVGLTTTLVGQIDLDDAIASTAVAGLDILPSGTRPPNPAELLQTQAMTDLLTTLGRQYDVVLIDAPPLLPVTDGALLAAESDGAFLVVRHGRTTRSQVRTAMDRLDGVGATLNGVVLTMAPARGSDKYGYGYGYSSAPSPRASEQQGRRARR